MPETFESLAVVFFALLPGGLYVWSFERQAGAWGIKLSDRLFRFLGFSALLHGVFAPVTYVLWEEFIRSGLVSSGEAPLGLWVVPLVYVALPVLLGSLVGRGIRMQRPWATLFTGPDPAPRAWDHFFGSASDGWVRLHLKNGTWLGGAFVRRPDGSRSYASGYPEAQDLFLVDTVEVDPETGAFVIGDEGVPLSRGSSMLIRWDEVEYLDFIEARRRSWEGGGP